MLYARRHADGHIEAVFKAKPRGPSEAVAADHPDLAAFLAGDGKSSAGKSWTSDDMAMVRVVEDLIDVLIQKNLIALTDFPLSAQRKLMSRHGKRDDWAYVARLYPTSKDDELG